MDPPTASSLSFPDVYLTAPAYGRLTGKVAIITGSARGIGAATAAKFALEGARVVLCDVRDDLGHQAAAEINRAFGNGSPVAIFEPVDVAERKSVQRLVQRTVEVFGRLDILVNNAGIILDAQLQKMLESDFDRVIDINLKGTFTCGQVAAQRMLEQGDGGVILNATSVVSLDGNFGQTNYAAAKAGVIGMTKVWARELGPKGIRVNAVAPGFIETPMTSQMPRKIYDTMVERTPMRRAGRPEDIANVYLWLASDEASFVSGAVIRVDGGIVIGT